MILTPNSKVLLDSLKRSVKFVSITPEEGYSADEILKFTGVDISKK